MRWITKKLTEGETREVRKFLFLPLGIGLELRWLEFVIIRQQVRVRSFESYFWENIAFVEEKKDES